MSQSTNVNKVETLRWLGDAQGYLMMIDQTRLPNEVIELECRDVEAVWEAIKNLRVRGAPAIGIAAAYGVVLGLQTVRDDSAQAFDSRLDEVLDYLATSRPTAVNLFWALGRIKHRSEELGREHPPQEIRQQLLHALVQARRCPSLSLAGRMPACPWAAPAGHRGPP